MAKHGKGLVNTPSWRTNVVGSAPFARERRAHSRVERAAHRNGKAVSMSGLELTIVLLQRSIMHDLLDDLGRMT